MEMTVDGIHFDGIIGGQIVLEMETCKGVVLVKHLTIEN